MKHTVSLVSLGCPKNLVDAEVMLGHLPGDRYEIITDESRADIIIVNTCSFIKEAKEESVETILEVADQKKSGRCRLLVVTGCLPQRYRDELAPSCRKSIFFSVPATPRAWSNCSRTTWAAADSRGGGRAGVPLRPHHPPGPLVALLFRPTSRSPKGAPTTAPTALFPQLRGPLRSRSLASVVQEVRRLVGAGVKEVNLIAQDITAYGADLDDGTRIETLLRELVQIEDLQWLRLLYAYPDGISEELIELIATEEKICNYLDIPLQHVDDTILAMMNRRIDEAGIRHLIGRLRARIPGITLRTSFIVGFPGETDAQFERLLDFVEEGHFERLGVFRYSREEGTAAADLTDQIPERVKESRYQKLMKAQSRVSFRKNRALVGSIEPVLVEGYSEETELLLRGRSIRQAPDVDGQVYITAGHAEVGDIVRCASPIPPNTT